MKLLAVLAWAGCVAAVDPWDITSPDYNGFQWTRQAWEFQSMLYPNRQLISIHAAARRHGPVRDPLLLRQISYEFYDDETQSTKLLETQASSEGWEVVDYSDAGPPPSATVMHLPLDQEDPILQVWQKVQEAGYSWVSSLEVVNGVSANRNSAGGFLPNEQVYQFVLHQSGVHLVTANRWTKLWIGAASGHMIKNP